MSEGWTAFERMDPSPRTGEDRLRNLVRSLKHRLEDGDLDPPLAHMIIGRDQAEDVAEWFTPDRLEMLTLLTEKLSGQEKEDRFDLRIRALIESLKEILADRALAYTFLTRQQAQDLATFLTGALS